MAIPDLHAVWATTAKATDISDRLAGGITITPVITLDSSVVVAQAVPTVVTQGVGFRVLAGAAYWDDDIDAILALNSTGWLCLYDTTIPSALLLPAVITATPARALTADPSRAMRSALAFEPSDDDRVPYHVAPGLAATQRVLISPSSGITINAQTAASSSVSVAAGAITLACIEGE